jgi:hypothetical protein
MKKKEITKMASKYITLKGKGKWMRLFEDNRDLTGYQGSFQETDGACTMDLYITKEEYAKLKEAGSATKLKLDEETGERFIKLKRPFKGKYEWASGAPKVTKDDGSVWSFEDDGSIGNMSEVEVTVVVYTTSMTPGTRLESVKVTKHVPYVQEDKVLETEGVPF